MRARRAMRLLLLTCLAGVAVTATGEAAPPWAMLAHRVIGRVEQLSQKPQGQQAGFDVATVILNADATKVYATAVGMLRSNQSVRVVAEDAAHRTVEFSNGARSAGITVTDLGTRLSQIMVASAVMPGQDSATERVVEGVLRVCQAMKVTCSPR
ncbi:MAG TPA: hypothetical protein VFE12_19420 [Acetobacteraceae bacterium]|jgi:hypothetical protein|nr:hypothetical protein [Acetobacteraceae bacterium]